MLRLLTTLAFSALMFGYSFGCETTDLLTRMFHNPGIPVILTRPTCQHSWEAPGGVFKIHYDTEGPLAVYEPDVDVDPADGIPDYVNRTADFLNTAYSVYIDQLGFDPPPPDGEGDENSLYDIYLTDVPALTTPESRSDYYPGREAYTSYIQLGHDLRTPHYPDDPLPFLKVSAAHEFFHAVQFAYRAYSSDPTPWWFEACAGWGEERVFDDVNDVYYKLHYYLPNLHKSLYQSDGFFTYGTWLFAQYLSDNFGQSIIRQCWEKFASFDFAITAIDLVLDTHGADFNDEYIKHIVWNYFTGENYAPGFYEEAASFDESVYPARVHTSYPVDWVIDPMPQENVSGAYFVFENPSGIDGTLNIDYVNTTDDKHGVALISVKTNGEVLFHVHLVQNYVMNTFTVENFGSCEKVIMATVWLYEGLPETGITSYSYSAHIDSAAVGIASGYKDQPSEFAIDQVYPNPFNADVRVSFVSPRSGDCRFVVYGISGDRVFESKSPVSAGFNSLTWSPADNIASGVHFFRIIQYGNSISGKFIYLK